MPEGDSIKAQMSGNDEEGGGQIWRKIKSLIFRRDQEPSLREQIEDAITEHEEEANVNEETNGDLLPVERIMLRNLLQFSDHDVDDIMVPRSDMIAVEENSSFEQCVALFSEHGHSRLPVYRENLDNIIGMIHIKDFFALITNDAKFADKKEQDNMLPNGLEPYLRQPRFVPQSMGVLDLLADMRATRTHLAIILDEYSGTEGLVTIEDLVEQIVGDIEDEHDDDPTEDLIQISPGIWEVDARAELEEAADRIDPKLAEIEGDVHTLGGLAFSLTDKVPSVGETILHPASGWTLKILEGDEKRVLKIRLIAPTPSDQ